MTERQTPHRWNVLLRGLMQHCPQCGLGPIYAAYMKPVQSCADCGEDFSTIRADDGPAWLTIMVIGHLVVPVIMVMAVHAIVPSWPLLLVLFAAVFGLVLLLLPRAKSIFIGMIWLAKKRRSVGDGKYADLIKIP